MADLSHRLRTPLTAPAAGGGVAADTRTGRPGSRPGVDALERAVTAVINEARRRARDRAACDAVAVDRGPGRVLVGAGRGPVPGASRSDLGTGPLPVAVAADDLAALRGRAARQRLRAHPRRAPFTVRLTARPGGGGGPASRRRARLRPGQRPPQRGESGAGSTGLGLDIARRTAESSGGSLSLRSSPEGGASVILFLAEA